MPIPVASSQQRRRYVSLDGLRFIAAMGVVAHHYAGLGGAPIAETLFAKNYLFVDFFFAISGFVIFHNYVGRVSTWSAYGDFLKNRLARIYPLHLFTCLVYVALAFTLWRDRIDRSFVDSSALLPNLLLVHAWGTTQATSFNYPSWSISAEWLAYLSFPAVGWLIARGGARAAVLVAILLIDGLDLASAGGIIEPWTTLTYHFGALRAAPTFLLGAALAQGIERIPLKLTGFGWAWACFAGAILAMMAGVHDQLILLLLLASVAAAAIAERDGATGLLTRPFMVALGDLSYAIYMIHPLMAVALINLVAGKILHLAGAPLTLWCIFCALAANVGVAAAVHKWIEVPSRNYLRRAQLPIFASVKTLTRINQKKTAA